jgi:hypothetical protein
MTTENTEPPFIVQWAFNLVLFYLGVVILVWPVWAVLYFNTGWPLLWYPLLISLRSQCIRGLIHD